MSSKQLFVFSLAIASSLLAATEVVASPTDLPTLTFSDVLARRQAKESTAKKSALTLSEVLARRSPNRPVEKPALSFHAVLERNAAHSSTENSAAARPKYKPPQPTLLGKILSGVSGAANAVAGRTNLRSSRGAAMQRRLQQQRQQRRDWQRGAAARAAHR